MLAGAFAPVDQEYEVAGPLAQRGLVPKELEGMLVRNGPNPATVPDPLSHRWCAGDGMVHAIELSGGKATAYRNRWVRTRALAEQLGTAPPGGLVEPLDGPANAHVHYHAGRLLALAESGLPLRLSPKLATMGVEDFDAMVSSPISPLPRVDPATGGMTMIGYDCFGPPYLRYHELDAAGALVHSTSVALPRPTVHHDFALTETRVVFMDLPAVYDLELAKEGNPLPFSWQPEHGARLGVLSRGRPGEETRWFAIEPRFVFHVMNARDAGEAIVVEVCRHQRAFLAGRAPVPVLERWEIDPPAGRVTTTQLDDLGVEWPRVDERLVGLPYRFGYCATPPPTPGADPWGPLVRYDLAQGQRSLWDPGPGKVAGEPVFVPAPDGRQDDEGWILSVITDIAGGPATLVVLDASTFGPHPVATVELPHPVPLGHHGSFIPRHQLAEVRGR